VLSHVEGVSAHNSTKHNILVKKSKKRRKNELLFKTDVKKKKTEGVWHLLNITMTSSLFCNGKKNATMSIPKQSETLL